MFFLEKTEVMANDVLVAAPVQNRTRTYDLLNNKLQEEEPNGIIWRHPYNTCGLIWKDEVRAPPPLPALGFFAIFLR